MCQSTLVSLAFIMNENIVGDISIVEKGIVDKANVNKK